MGPAARAQDDPPGRIGRVADVAGDVRTIASDGRWIPVPRNRPLTTGDRITTDHQGHATLEFGSSSFRLGPDTDVTVQQLDDLRLRVHFDHGALAVRVRSADIVGELGVDTDEGLWVPHHPGSFRFDRAPRAVLAGQAWSGDMLLEAADSSLPIAAGQRAQVWRAGPQQTTHYHAVPIADDAFAAWVRAQDRQDDAESAATLAANPMPPEMTGGRALDRQGRWNRAPDVGLVWTPNRVPAGWAPYQGGTWTWMSPWGWTWIDDAPWGFAPFHYGRWLVLQGRWAWTPGHWTGRPVYAPALVGWLGGPGFSMAGSPAVGWVPLAPGEAFFPAYPVSQKYWNAINTAASVAVLNRPVLPAGGRSRFAPSGPAAYANRGGPDAVAVVAASLLAAPQAVATAPGADRKRLAAEVVASKATALPPPAPPEGHSLLGGSAPVVPLVAAAAAR